MIRMRRLFVCIALVCCGCSRSTTKAGGEELPKDALVYPGVKVTMAQSAPQQHLANLVLESTDPYDRIVDFYRKGLESNGWKIENTMTSEQVSAFTAVKGNRRTIVQLLDGGGKRTINLTVSDKP